MTKIRRDRSRGQGLVEFALIFPVLVLVLFGVFDFGRAIFAYNTLANAARAGVRVAIVNQNGPSLGCAGGSGGTPPDTTKVSAQDCALQAAVSLGGTTVTITYRDITDQTNCTVTGGNPDGSPVKVGCLAVVQTSYTFHPITPIISNVVGNSIQLTSTSKEPVEFVCPINTTLKCTPGS